MFEAVFGVIRFEIIVRTPFHQFTVYIQLCMGSDSFKVQSSPWPFHLPWLLLRTVCLRLACSAAAAQCSAPLCVGRNTVSEEPAFHLTAIVHGSSIVKLIKTSKRRLDAYNLGIQELYL